MIRILFFLWILCWPSLVKGLTNAQQAEQSPPPITVTQGCPSALVAGCVNAIAGIYHDQEVDLVIPAVKPLVYERKYFSLGYDWTDCQSGFLGFMRDDLKKGRYHQLIAKCANPDGTFLVLSGKLPEKSDHPFVLIPNPVIMGPGLTNTNRGEISARTHPKNTFIQGIPSQIESWMVTGSGEVVTYRRDLTPDGSQLFYELSAIRKPSGHRFKYEYDKSLALVRQVTLINDTHTNTFGYYKLHHLQEKDFKKRLSLLLESSDGRQCHYFYTLFTQEKNQNPKIYLNRVVRPDGPDVTYQYEKVPKSNSAVLVYTHKPDGRYLGLNYIHRQEAHSDGFGTYRIRSIVAPAGPDGQACEIHRFHYQRKGDGGGFTEVLDPYDHKTTYHYDKNKRLSFINHMHDTESFMWSQEGNLIAKRIDNSQGCLFTQHYTYDAKGNIVTQRTYGNFSGRQGALALSNGLPLDGQECEVVTNTYYSNEYNLKHIEAHEKTSYHYAYLPGTELLTERYLVDTTQNCIHRRLFRDYDALNAVAVETEDDGDQLRGSLKGCTERHLKYITNRTIAPAVGLPEEIKEMYIDMTTANEHLLKRIVNHYSIYGKLIRQDIYDACNTYQYSRKWEFDAKGNLIKEVDPIGVETRREYDTNGNCIRQYGPGDDIQKFYYDRMNRLITSEHIGSDGQVLISKKAYDLNGHVVTETNIYGQQTAYAYDDKGRVIEIQLPSLADGSRPTIRKTYDTFGHLTSETDALGNITYKTHNIRGQPTCIQYPDSSKEIFRYHINGTLAEKITKTGLQIRYTYDAVDRLIKEETHSPEGELLTTVSHAYNKWHLISTTDPEGYITHYQYDPVGRLIATCRQDVKTTFTYDSLGRVESETTWQHDIPIITKHYKRDFLDRIIEESTYWQGEIQRKKSYTYDAKGRLILEAKENSITNTEYNLLDQPIKITDALGNVTDIHCGCLTSIEVRNSSIP